jgi:ABC-2 type transport system permease protein
MRELIHAEWYKLWHNRLFLIILVIIAAQGIMQVGLINFINSKPIAAQQEVSLNEMYNFPPLGQNGVRTVGGTSLVLSICLAAFAGLFIASEFQNNTIRAVVALGKKRLSIYFSKFFSIGAAIAFFILMVSIVTTLGLTLFYGFGSISIAYFGAQTIKVLLMQFLLHFTYASIFCMIAFLCRNMGITIVLSAAWVLAIAILMSFLATFDDLAFIVKGLPVYYISSFNIHSDDPLFILDGVLVSVIYISVPFLIGYRFFKKVDIK